jgi:hypothetical protein
MSASRKSSKIPSSLKKQNAVLLTTNNYIQTNSTAFFLPVFPILYQ